MRIRRPSHAIRACAALVLSAAVLAACSDSGGGSADNAASSGPPAASAPAGSTPPSPPTAPAFTLTYQEALDIVRQVDFGPAGGDTAPDDARVDGQFADPMLGLMRANARIITPDYRLHGPVGNLIGAQVLTGAADGHRWFAVAGRHNREGRTDLYLFRSDEADPAWKLAFWTQSWEMDEQTAEFPEFPEVAKSPDGGAASVDSPAGLAADPAQVCASLAQARNGVGTEAWGPHLAAAHSARKDLDEQMRADRRTSSSAFEAVPGVLGPAWRTADGGALVACAVRDRWSVGIMPGSVAIGWEESRYSVLKPGVRARSFVDTKVSMDLVHVPAAGKGKPDLVGSLAHPLDFTYEPFRP